MGSDYFLNPPPPPTLVEQVASLEERYKKALEENANLHRELKEAKSEVAALKVALRVLKER